ncbi:MAG: TIGR04086 family membrane protein [Bacillota bacterium]
MSRYSETHHSVLAVKRILWGLIVSLFLLIIGVVISGVAITVSNLDSSIILQGLILLNYLAILLGGLLTGANVERRGWLNGMFVGLIQTLMQLMAGLIWLDIPFSVGAGLMVLLGLVTGLLGGVVGINFK